MSISIPALFVLVGLLLYFPNWGWKTGEIKEVGRILLFCGLLVFALALRGTRLL
jgi:hypothetical protein